MTKINSGGILVSYRRQDTRHVAGRLFDRLAERFGRSYVFMDVVSIEPGFDYAEAINDAVSHCDVLLALIGQSWLSAVDERGRRRLDNPDDLVLLEVKAALDQGVRVIPVLVDGTSAPRQGELPEVIAGLTRRNCVRLDHETFGSDVGVLTEFLDRIILPESGRNAGGSSVLVGQDDVGPDGPADDSQQPSTSAIRAAPGATSTGPTRTMETTGVVSKRVVPAALTIALAVLAVAVVAGLIINSKQLGDTLGILGLLLLF